jgi:hypothetical protein
MSRGGTAKSSPPDLLFAAQTGHADFKLGGLQGYASVSTRPPSRIRSPCRSSFLSAERTTRHDRRHHPCCTAEPARRSLTWITVITRRFSNERRTFSPDRRSVEPAWGFEFHR